VFTLDGVLLGAGDAAYMRAATLSAALLGFLPVVWASLRFGWGLVGIWSGLSAFLLIRMITLLGRLRTGRWGVPGAVRGPPSRTGRSPPFFSRILESPTVSGK